MNRECCWPRTTVENRRRALGVWLFVLIGLASGFVSSAACRPTADIPPPSERISTRFLDREVGEALTALDEVRAALHNSDRAAEAHLGRARLSLVRLRDYYLPLLHARDRAQNAQRFYELDDMQGTLSELSAIESLLLDVSDRAGPQLSRELDSPVERAVRARAAVKAGRREAGELIERLADQINLLLLKGELALQSTELGH